MLNCNFTYLYGVCSSNELNTDIAPSHGMIAEHRIRPCLSGGNRVAAILVEVDIGAVADTDLEIVQSG